MVKGKKNSMHRFNAQFIQINITLCKQTAIMPYPRLPNRTQLGPRSKHTLKTLYYDFYLKSIQIGELIVLLL